MRAFLRRHWLLLFCAFFLVTCSFYNFSFSWGYEPPPEFRKFRRLDPVFSFELNYGIFMMNLKKPGRTDTNPAWGIRSQTHSPRFRTAWGGPICAKSGWVYISVWLPLVVVLGCIAFLELLWHRHQRAMRRGLGGQESG